MNSYPTKTNTTHTAHQQTNNLAKALFEQEQNRQSAQMGSDNGAGLDPFTQALARSGSQLDWGNQLDPAAQDPDWQQNAEKQKRLEMMRRKLHEQINPVNEQQVFAAREEEVKAEIDKLRQELKGLARDVVAFDKEVELTLMTQVAEPRSGKYFFNFLHKLRLWIMSLRMKVQKAASWATTISGKNTKKRKHFGAGIMVDGNSFEQTKSIFDTMHHERSMTYGGS